MESLKTILGIVAAVVAAIFGAGMLVQAYISRIERLETRMDTAEARIQALLTSPPGTARASQSDDHASRMSPLEERCSDLAQRVAMRIETAGYEDMSATSLKMLMTQLGCDSKAAKP
jgi:hypothetical protein